MSTFRPLFTTTSAASTVNCNPHETAMPTFAAASAGLSLRPSPSMPTTLAPRLLLRAPVSKSCAPRPASRPVSQRLAPSFRAPKPVSPACWLRIQDSFWAGAKLAAKSVRPTRRATAAAGSLLSPVSNTTSTPESRSAFTALAASGRMESSMRRTMTTSSSIVMYTVVKASASFSQALRAAAASLGRSTHMASKNLALPAPTTMPSTMPHTPFDSTRVKFVTRGNAPRPDPAANSAAQPMWAFTMLLASGCGSRDSRAARRRKSSCLPRPPAYGRMAVSTTSNWPSVRVPVLSTPRARICDSVSRAWAPFTRTCKSPSSRTKTQACTIGAAATSAHGQAPANAARPRTGSPETIASTRAPAQTRGV
mmetsp:Transcript_63573/g.196882  ORF Transcript_63573/g.196882 Transcript_63573/m.196882 type:complete len:366 (-) Transcript_63573:1216-2313(-)